MRDVTDELPSFLRMAVRTHDAVTLRDLLLLAERHRDFLRPLFTELLDDFVEEVQRPATDEEICDLDYLEICWEWLSIEDRFDLNPVLVGRNHREEEAYSIEAIPTFCIGHLPILLKPRFVMEIPAEGATGIGAGAGTDGGGRAQGMFRRELRRGFTLHDVFDAVLSEITSHGPPTERDEWWREIGSRQNPPGDAGSGSA
jgi:hypothetical protein